MTRRGRTITEESGQVLASDLRKRRFDANRQRARRRGVSGSSDVRHFKTGVGGIPAYNDTTKQLGSAACREWIPNESGVLSDGGNDETIYNQHAAIASGVYILAITNEAGLLVAIEKPPPANQFDVRVKPDGTALQKSTDGGATWTDWATIGTC